jgi:hypothetical protein
MSEILPDQVCKSCGTPFKGFYCNVCGEKVLKPADRSFRAFLSHLLQAITFADGKVLKTLALVVSNPGFVSREFADGRRVNYLKPISLFFVLNLIYFLFPIIQLFNASLNTQLMSPQGELVSRVVSYKMVAGNIHNISSFSLIYNQTSTSLAKLMVMVFVVLASLPLNFLYRKSKLFFADHVGFTVELVCFNLFLNAILLTVLTRLFGLGRYVDELTLTVLFVSTNLYFLLRSGYTYYHETGWKLVLKSVLMLLFMKVALEVYRAILFYVTIAVL